MDGEIMWGGKGECRRVSVGGAWGSSVEAGGGVEEGWLRIVVNEADVVLYHMLYSKRKKRLLCFLFDITIY